MVLVAHCAHFVGSDSGLDCLVPASITLRFALTPQFPPSRGSFPCNNIPVLTLRFCYPHGYLFFACATLYVLDYCCTPGLDCPGSIVFTYMHTAHIPRCCTRRALRPPVLRRFVMPFVPSAAVWLVASTQTLRCTHTTFIPATRAAGYVRTRLLVCAALRTGFTGLYTPLHHHFLPFFTLLRSTPTLLHFGLVLGRTYRAYLLVQRTFCVLFHCDSNAHISNALRFTPAFQFGYAYLLRAHTRTFTCGCCLRGC